MKCKRCPYVGLLAPGRAICDSCLSIEKRSNYDKINEKRRKGGTNKGQQQHEDNKLEAHHEKQHSWDYDRSKELLSQSLFRKRA